MTRRWTHLMVVALLCGSLSGPEIMTGQVMAAASGASAPAFELVTFSGEAYSKETLKGRPTLLVFWASWCPVCRKELPVLSRFYEKGRPAQLRMISIGFSDLRGNIERYVQANPEAFVFPTAFDVDNDVAQAFKVSATPTLVLLDANGAIVLVHRGAGVLNNPKFQEFLTAVKA